MGIDILIPVLGRTQAAQRMARSLQGTSTDYRLLFICSKKAQGDISDCLKLGEVMVVDWDPGAGDFARKINAGFRGTEAEWVFQGATDIIFHPGWDEAALHAARTKDRRVVGTNDLHNPAVQRGKHSTHTLFARSYIEEAPGTVDGSDPVFWEGYDHQFVDVEFIEVAKRRKEWIFARNAIVEHFHPHWGNAERDSTYTKAMRRTQADRRLYMERMGLQGRSRQSQRIIDRQARLKKRRERDIPTT